MCKGRLPVPASQPHPFSRPTKKEKAALSSSKNNLTRLTFVAQVNVHLFLNQKTNFH